MSDTSKMKPVLPSDAAARKEVPLVRGLLDYFPSALAAVAAVSKKGNDQHNPGQPMHHARGKSSDHADCIVRHLVDRGTIDSDGIRHSAKVAWRALALLQEELEKEEGAPLARGARVPGPLKVYVASKFTNQEPVREAQRLFAHDGHIITYDWTQEKEHSYTGAEKRAFWKQCADADMKGVLEADVLVLLPVPGMQGGWFEFGAAIAAGKPCILIGSKEETVFVDMSLVTHVASIGEAANVLNKMAGK